MPPLWLLINECANIVKWARRTNLIPDISGHEANDCLLVFNVKDRYWHTVPSTKIIRELYAQGRFRGGISDRKSQRLEGALPTKSLSKKCSPEWEARLAKYLFVDSPDALFTITPSTKLHGLNTYSYLRVFAHIAALNPTPPLIALYAALLGDDYDTDLDHSIENLVQTLYRTSLRDPKAKDKVLMIVPYREQAELLQGKIRCSDFTYVREPRLTPFSYSKANDKADQKANGRRGGLRSAEVRALNMTPVQKTKYRSMSSMISKYRKLIKDRPSDVRRPHWEQRITTLTQEKHAMVLNAKANQL